MNTPALLNHLQSNGVRVDYGNGATLILDGPEDVLNDAVLERLRDQRADVLTWLKTPYVVQMLCEHMSRDEADDIHQRFWERWAIAEIDGGLACDDALQLAVREVCGVIIERRALKPATPIETKHEQMEFLATSSKPAE